MRRFATTDELAARYRVTVETNGDPQQRRRSGRPDAG